MFTCAVILPVPYGLEKIRLLTEFKIHIFWSYSTLGIKENVTKLSSQLPLLRGQTTWQSITSEKKKVYIHIFEGATTCKKKLHTIIQNFLNFALKINNAMTLRNRLKYFIVIIVKPYKSSPNQNAQRNFSTLTFNSLCSYAVVGKHSSSGTWACIYSLSISQLSVIFQARVHGSSIKVLAWQLAKNVKGQNTEEKWGFIFFFFSHIVFNCGTCLDCSFVPNTNDSHPFSPEKQMHKTGMYYPEHGSLYFFPLIFQI